MDPLFDFSAKVVLITGGSRGLGKAMARAFAERGANLVIASRNLETCEKLAAELETLGVEAIGYRFHVGHWAELDGLVEAAYERFGRVDVLINNAGLSPLYPSLVEVSEELFDKVVALNLKAPFRLSALVATRMAQGAGGAIINISSTASLRPTPEAEPYGAAKAGLNALTRSLAWEYGPRVRVNCIVAGPFLTDISKAWDMAAFERRAQSTMAIPRGGAPEEIVAAALYLAGPGAAFTTGTTIRVDGGTP